MQVIKLSIVLVYSRTSCSMYEYCSLLHVSLLHTVLSLEPKADATHTKRSPPLLCLLILPTVHQNVLQLPYLLLGSNIKGKLTKPGILCRSFPDGRQNEGQNLVTFEFEESRDEIRYSIRTAVKQERSPHHNQFGFQCLKNVTLDFALSTRRQEKGAEFSGDRKQGFSMRGQTVPSVVSLNSIAISRFPIQTGAEVEMG